MSKCVNCLNCAEKIYSGIEKEKCKGTGSFIFDTEKISSYNTVTKPFHYNDYGIEVIEIIKRSLTPDQFFGYCLGNEIKYRMRAGLKDNNSIQQDIEKALEYRKYRKN